MNGSNSVISVQNVKNRFSVSFVCPFTRPCAERDAPCYRIDTKSNRDDRNSKHANVTRSTLIVSRVKMTTLNAPLFGDTILKMHNANICLSRVRAPTTGPPSLVVLYTVRRHSQSLFVFRYVKNNLRATTTRPPPPHTPLCCAEKCVSDFRTCLPPDGYASF